ncbi:uncharacterized protein EI90DRAFT_3130229 [Cantharellus anzutake]|uniref:uncharacterized protein n=1 Tax=Cantharellus anzutake TaxID=1750568 RepID=UPI0019050814|nr:uncharacterized protein EI90DRAFT_3130229 [Cantharellus anzutake]KAF8323593.1 hypothetical protein EI90DRAFT_3130229 [Cantharellus anzutake]
MFYFNDDLVLHSDARPSRSSLLRSATPTHPQLVPKSWTAALRPSLEVVAQVIANAVLEKFDLITWPPRLFAAIILANLLSSASFTILRVINVSSLTALLRESVR